MSPRNLRNAELFGQSLDQDDFETTQGLLDVQCEYIIGDETLHGPLAITHSYKQNMIDGRKKMDELIWGESWIEPVSTDSCYVHFTDYLKHKGETHTHKCKQHLFFNSNGLIERIEHVNNHEEQKRLARFYKRVGIPTTL